MITLVAPLLGLAIGAALGGQFERLAAVPYRWLPFGALALAVQLALFSTALGEALGPLAPIAYVLSTAAVLAVVVRNVSLPRMGIPGLAIVALGASANLAAIVANGGWMPLDPGALAALAAAGTSGMDAAGGYSNSLLLANPVLAPLVDRIVIPGPGPLAAIVSLGDLFIALGLFAAIVQGMRGPDGPREPVGDAVVSPPGAGSAAGR